MCLVGLNEHGPRTREFVKMVNNYKMAHRKKQLSLKKNLKIQLQHGKGSHVSKGKNFYDN